ncbi:hypothetical protein BDA99DRAFT_557745 [Phascolomyces articulosus]|uniref:Uncharacterized protein n=1 Tax=Phascolomyces articulosus TaxID=60185 RepID=A0AAD5PGB0_9FUNG|nr:hypothetical protein BDA99DRAFT_557745 [Phascolomyces articulosus]
MLLKTTTSITARNKLPIRLLRPKCFIRCIESSDESSRPFPSPYPTRPALIAKPDNGKAEEGEYQEKLLPVPLSTTHNVTNITNTEQLLNESMNDNDTFDQQRQKQQYQQHQQQQQRRSLIDDTPFQPQHHFDTYKLLLALESQGFSRTQAEVVMKGIKFKLRESSAFIRRRLLLKSDLDNETYLFKAGLSELRTEVQAMRRNDIQMLQADMSAVTREVEALGQRLREDVSLMRNDVTLDLNNRKNEGREELKSIDMRIQEINNRITVSLGDVRTDIEAVRWETIWKGMTGVAVAAMGIATLGYLLTRYAARKAESIRIQKQRQLKQLQEDARHAGTADMEVVY